MPSLPMLVNHAFDCPAIAGSSCYIVPVSRYSVLDTLIDTFIN